jgi:hypothetical protein
MTKKMKSNGDAADVDRLVSDKVSEVLPMYLPCRLMRSVGMNGLKTRGPSDVTVLSPPHTHTLSLSPSLSLSLLLESRDTRALPPDRPFVAFVFRPGARCWHHP